MKKLVPLIMLLMTASAANAGGLVTRHQSSLQHTVDPTRTITSRTANSFLFLVVELLWMILAVPFLPQT